MLSDIEIAQNAHMKRITEIAANIGINEEDLEPYGHYKAKVSEDVYSKVADKENGKLILVTAINPTPAGEGKTTVSVGLSEAMRKIGKKSCPRTPRAFSRTCFWHEGRSCRRWLLSGSSHGGYQSSLYR